MTDKPTIDGAEPESPRHSPESSPPPAADSARSAWAARVTATPPAATRPARSPRKLILVPVVLAVIGLALLLAGFLVYPRRAGLPAPVPGFVVISANSSYVNAHISLIYFTVDQVHPDVAVVTIEVDLWPSMPPGARLDIQLDEVGATVTQCSPYCSEKDVAPAVWDAKPYFQYRSAMARFSLKAHSLGVAANGAAAEVAFPGLYFTGTQPTNLVLTYSIPSADSYDWSPYPPTSILFGSQAVWYEPVIHGFQTVARIASGVNHAAETTDGTLTLVAGVLFGLGGGALVAAAQEALHD
jgi:hypothetical protein